MLSALQIRILLAVGVLVAIGGLGLAIYKRGVNSGYKSGQAVQLAYDNKSFAQERLELKQAINDSQQLISAMRTQLDALQTQQQLINAKLTRAGSVSSTVASGPFKGLPAVPVTVITPPTAPADCTEIVGVLTEDINNLQQQVAVTLGEVNALRTEESSILSSYNSLVVDYTKAYNAAQPHHSLFVRIITFGLVRNKQLKLPKPISLSKAG